MSTDTLRTVVKLFGGPEHGGTIMGFEGEPPDEIAVFRTQMLKVGTLVCGPTDSEHGLLEGDHIYRKVSRSELLDRPDWKNHRNIMPGCGYVFVRTVTENTPLSEATS